MAQAPYVSPYIHVDLNYDKAVLQIRDSDTGDVLNQFPSQKRLEALARDAARQASVSPSPKKQEESAQAYVEKTQPRQQAQSAPQAQPAPQQQVSSQQIAAFEAASHAGQSTGGDVTVLA
ncbi:MAG: hypothetical protein H6868_05225 [Rhodospirillales bacterium]|nr:hypothetical protein [Rhodospirillales bacterium]